MKPWKTAAVVGLMAVSVCCTRTAGEEEPAHVVAAIDNAAKEALVAANERLLDAYLTRDIDGWLAGFADDVLVMPPGEGMVVGLDALREASQIMFDAMEKGETEYKGETLEIVVVGDWAYTRDGYEARHWPLDAGQPIIDRGRSLTIWKRQPDGAWLVSRHIANRPPRSPS